MFCHHEKSTGWFSKKDILTVKGTVAEVDANTRLGGQGRFEVAGGSNRPRCQDRQWLSRASLWSTATGIIGLVQALLMSPCLMSHRPHRDTEQGPDMVVSQWLRQSIDRSATCATCLASEDRIKQTLLNG